MIILGLDCGGTESRVSVSRGHEILIELSEPADRGKGDRFVPLIEHAMQQASVNIKDIDLIAACTGPGSFTGIRIGLAAAQGLAFALQKPVIGIDAFVLYHSAARDGNNHIAVIIESKRDELYVQIYDTAGQVVLPAQSMLPEAIRNYLNDLKNVFLCGDAAGKVFDDYIPTNQNTASMACSFAGELLQADYAKYKAEPYYIRQADAMPQAMTK